MGAIKIHLVEHGACRALQPQRPTPARRAARRPAGIPHLHLCARTRHSIDALALSGVHLAAQRRVHSIGALCGVAVARSVRASLTVVLVIVRVLAWAGPLARLLGRPVRRVLGRGRELG